MLTTTRFAEATGVWGKRFRTLKAPVQRKSYCFKLIGTLDEKRKKIVYMTSKNPLKREHLTNLIMRKYSTSSNRTEKEGLQREKELKISAMLLEILMI